MEIPATVAVTRRQFFSLTGLVGLCGLGGAGWLASLYQTPLHKPLRITSYDLATAKWPNNQPPLTIAFLTDLHVGCSSVDLTVLQHIVTQVNAMRTDIILLGGDFQTRLQRKFAMSYVPPQPIAEIIGQLTAPLGVHAVLGNHDWHTDGPGMTKALQAQHISVLENESFRIHKNGWDFWLVGLADYTTRQPDYQKAVQAIQDDLPRIVLSHDPITFAGIDDKPVVQLSGHTHGGQIKLPFIGPVARATPSAPMAWSYGHIQETGRQMIVSSGVGTSILPLKNTPNEVVRLTLRHANA